MSSIWLEIWSKGKVQEDHDILVLLEENWLIKENAACLGEKKKNKSKWFWGLFRVIQLDPYMKKNKCDAILGTFAYLV